MYKVFAGLFVSVAVCFTSVVNTEPLRDPTRPMSFKPASSAKTKLVLQAIYYGADRKQAVINGKLVNVGGEVAGVRITGISSNKVYYKQGARTAALILREKVSKATQ